MRTLMLASMLTLIIFLSGCGGTMKRTTIDMETNMGTMEFELYDDLAPVTAGNFKKLAEEGFYDGQRFHRIIKDFMAQAGDPQSKEVSLQEQWGTGGPGYTIQDELVDELRHDKKGLLSMANHGPNTGGSQFFITLVPTPWLDGKHAIFGRIIAGEDVLDKIGTATTGGNDRPIEDIIIQRVRTT